MHPQLNLVPNPNLGNLKIPANLYNSSSSEQNYETQQMIYRNSQPVLPYPTQYQGQQPYPTQYQGQQPYSTKYQGQQPHYQKSVEQSYSQLNNQFQNIQNIYDTINNSRHAKKQYQNNEKSKKILGTIEKVYYKDKRCQIKAESGELYACSYSHLSYLPIEANDKIYFYLGSGYNGNTIEKYPYVQLGIDQRSLIGCVMFGRGKKTSKQFALKFLEHIDLCRDEKKKSEKFLGKIKRLARLKDTHTFLSDCAVLYKNKKLPKHEITLLTNDGKIMKREEFTSLLTWWYKKRVLRQLYLFGLTNWEINYEENDLDPLDIYETILDNPFLILQLKISKCVNICNILEKEYTEEDKIMARIARVIQEKQVNSGWSGTPSWIVRKEVEKIRNEMGDKRTEYEICKEYIPIYVRPMIKIYGFEYMQVPNQNKGMFYTPLASKVETQLTNIFIEKINNKYNNILTPQFTKDGLDEDQKKAVEVSLNSDISIITGEAGSGKTTVIKQIYENADRLGLKTAITAYTGQAVSVLKKTIGNDSPSTMHMMIANSSNYEKFDHLIIDEISMIYSKLMYDFFMKFGYDYKITMVGDNNQLPPGKWGRILFELSQIKKIPVVRLLTNHRSDIKGENGILINARAILKYHRELKRASPEEQNFVEPFQFKPTKNFKIMTGGVDMVIKLISSFARAGINAANIMTLYPYNYQRNETLNILNKKAQEVFNLHKDYVIDTKGFKWMIGDCVIMTKNDYTIGVMNGDRGVIIDIIKKQEILKHLKKIPNPKLTTANHDSDVFDKILVKFRSGKQAEFHVTYTSDDHNPDYGNNSYADKEKLGTITVLKHSYAMTIHKSQGSETEFVILYFPYNDNASKFLNKHLMYTAMTRARMAMFCVCEPDPRDPEYNTIKDLEHACMRLPGVKYDTLAHRIMKKIN